MRLPAAVLLAAVPLAAADDWDRVEAAPAAEILAEVVDNPWARVARPSTRPPESLGSHSAGCLRGAAVLPAGGPGYEAMRLSRRRTFGHPRLVSYLVSLGAAVAADPRLGSILVGNLGQPRGGPAPSGHVSHQSGLDVDVWFLRWTEDRPPTAQERETLSAPSMVTPEFEGLSAAWDPAVIDVLRLAASDDSVERIFVNPVIKREACRLHPGAPWVRRLRAWWFHEDHFHVRLSCAPGDAQCRSTADPIPPGDGCGAELDSWFTPESRADSRRRREEPPSPFRMPALPAECAAVLSEP